MLRKRVPVSTQRVNHKVRTPKKNDLALLETNDGSSVSLNLGNRVSACQSCEAALTSSESHRSHPILSLKQEAKAYPLPFIGIFASHYIHGLVFLGSLDVNEHITLGIVLETF